MNYYNSINKKGHSLCPFLKSFYIHESHEILAVELS